MNLDDNNPVIPKILDLLKRDMYVGIVTAAGYSEKSGEKYMMRIKGLIDAIIQSKAITDEQKSNLLVMGGESNYLFRLNNVSGALDWIEPDQWQLPETVEWKDEDIVRILDLAESVLTTMKNKLFLPATIIRKYRGVGLVPLPGKKICRELLEEVVLNAQKSIEISDVAKRIQFCAFNGGNDVWVDIGDKRLGVMSLQNFLGDISGSQTLHVGDQFASIGANDFKARLAACTVWISSPLETVGIIDELTLYLDESNIYED